MASLSSHILPGRRFFPSAMAKEGVDIIAELKGVGWYDYVTRGGNWIPELVNEFWVGCATATFTHQRNDKSWTETGLSAKVQDVTVDVHTPNLSLATGCAHSGTSYTDSWEGTTVSSAEINTVLYGTAEPENKKAPKLASWKIRVLHKIVQHIICPRVGATDDVTRLEKFCLYHLITQRKASLPSIIRFHMIQCRTKSTKIPYGMLFMEIFRQHNILAVAARNGLPAGSEITMTNIKQMKIKIEPSVADPVADASAAPEQKVQKKVPKPPVKRPRVILSSDEEDTQQPEQTAPKERRTKKKQDPQPPPKKSRRTRSSRTSQPSAQATVHPSAQPSDQLSADELARQKVEEEGIDDQETIDLLRAFKNDLILRSPVGDSVEKAPLRYFLFLLTESQKALASDQPTPRPDDDPVLAEAVLQASRLADDKSLDLNMYFEQQDKLKALRNENAISLHELNQKLQKLSEEVISNPSAESVIHDLLNQKRLIQASQQSITRSLRHLEEMIASGMRRIEARHGAQAIAEENAQRAQMILAKQADEAQARKKRKDAHRQQLEAKHKENVAAVEAEIQAAKRQRLQAEEERRKQLEHAEDSTKPSDEGKVPSEGETFTIQPEALQVILPSRIQIYSPRFGPQPYRSQYRLELFTPGAKPPSVEMAFSATPLRRRRSPTKHSGPASQPTPLAQSSNLDGSLRIPGFATRLFPTLRLRDAYLHPHLMGPKDLIISGRLEQERRLVRHLTVPGTGPEGSLAKVIMRPSTAIKLAPDRAMPDLPPSTSVKGKEKMPYYKSQPQPFPKHFLLETSSIWAHELHPNNRKKLSAIPVAERTDWHAYRYLQDHHYQMIKQSSGSGLTSSDKEETPTPRGLYAQYPIDRIHHNFHDNWKLIPERPPHYWHLILMSTEFEKDLHVYWAYRLGWHIHFFKIAKDPLIPSIPLYFHPDGSHHLYPFIPFPRIKYLTYEPSASTSSSSSSSPPWYTYYGPIPQPPILPNQPSPPFLPPSDQPSVTLPHRLSSPPDFQHLNFILIPSPHSPSDPTPPHIDSPAFFPASPRPPTPTPPASPVHTPPHSTPPPSLPSTSLVHISTTSTLAPPSALPSDPPSVHSLLTSLVQNQHQTNALLQQQNEQLQHQGARITQLEADREADRKGFQDMLQILQDLLSRK